MGTDQFPLFFSIEQTSMTYSVEIRVKIRKLTQIVCEAALCLRKEANSLETLKTAFYLPASHAKRWMRKRKTADEEEWEEDSVQDWKKKNKHLFYEKKAKVSHCLFFPEF